MKNVVLNRLLSFASVLVFLLAFGCAAERPVSVVPPKVIYADPDALAEAKAKFQANDGSLKPAFKRLLSNARVAMRTKPVSVMDKRRIPPSGDKHDFVSQAPYFWPDTNSPGHYLRRDGERNPES